MTQTVASWTRRRGPADRHWQLAQLPDRFVLVIGDQAQEFRGADVASLTVGRSWFVPALKVSGEDRRQRLRGLGRRQAQTLKRALAHYLARHRVDADLQAVTRWHAQVRTVLDSGYERMRWIPEESVRNLEESKPRLDPHAWPKGLHRTSLDDALSDEERRALDFLDVDVRALVAETNESILRAELVERSHFLENVERTPLTEEQARAVVCFDNRVQVIAAAGSGKTSVMVARAAYAIERGFVPPGRCLLLAFNRDAARELQERIDSRLTALELPTDGLKASTFHAFGLGLIGQATGRKPRLAPWLDQGQDVKMVSRIVDELRDRSWDFRFKWDVFRLLYARVSDKPDGGEPDGWDQENRRHGFRTRNGEVVKSEGERLIADFLFLNGVSYRYEQPYPYDVAGPDHSQYRPDFYYRQIDTWHEHWAIGHDGKPPASFTGYAKSMEWKRQLHLRHKTRLVETTWAQIIGFDGLKQLATELTGLGIKLDWNPDRYAPGVGGKPVRHEDLARLMRTFMTHVKSNSLTPAAVEKRMADGTQILRSPRTRLFLDLYWQIHEEWQARLAAEECVDFEDMLVRAAEHLEAGNVSSRYDLIMVDEFQDASQARARLVRALVNQPGKYLLAVGDDWQSINRFAGADISVMTNFESWFGRAQTLRLQTTFRCPQSITDVASSFISKNPKQLRKHVRSAIPGPGLPVNVHYVEAEDEITGAISDFLSELDIKLREGEIEPGKDGRLAVDVLGRYNFDRQLVPRRTPRRIDVTFRTVHKSKGLEADYIVVPNLTNGLYGFPSQMEDDPVLDVVMADPDEYPHAEERRLFYVAITRAKREVVLMAQPGRESPFVAELIDGGQVTVRNTDAGPPMLVCPQCKQGMLVRRTGRSGQFFGCSRFPRCRHTQNDRYVAPANPF